MPSGSELNNTKIKESINYIFFSFLRPQRDYTPPEDLEIKLKGILERTLGSVDDSTQIQDLNERYQVFNACYEEFQHGIPNSLLFSIETVEDVKKFYATPVSTITPYDNLKNIELPPNLHVQYDYHRFHPGEGVAHIILIVTNLFVSDTDTKFKGVTAFPKSSTIVTGLKYKDKYKGHEQRETWPYSQ